MTDIVEPRFLAEIPAVHARLRGAQTALQEGSHGG